jgi:DNA-binding CsgD family transcriptional regulator
MFSYANFLRLSQGSPGADVLALLTRALEIAEGAGATALTSRIVASLSHDAFLRGQVEEGFAFLARGWALARASQAGPAFLGLAVHESDALLKLARFPSAADVALRGLGPARQAGLGASWAASILEANAAEALLAMGRTSEAAALIDPLISGPPTRDRWVVHETRADIDLLCGDIDEAARRRQLIDAFRPDASHADQIRETTERAAELALWAGRPGDALAEVRRALSLFKTPDMTILCGRLLTAGMRACADLTEQARARRDETATAATVAAADDLASWARQVPGGPFTDHPFVAIIPAERATWDAERARLAGPSDPAVSGAAGKAWQDLGCPHRAGYAWWRQAQAQLDAGQPATSATVALRAAAAAADGHEPLLAQIRALAQRARIPLQAPPAAPENPPPVAVATYGLTEREVAVLRLLAAGRTNAQIGPELYISPKTASVHVTSIFRKLGSE